MKQGKLRAVMSFTVDSKDLHKIQKIIEFAEGLNVVVDYKSLNTVFR